MSDLVAILMVFQFLLFWGSEMISIDFLKGSRTGLEFMDFQNDSFFKELTSHLTQYINNGILDPTVEDGLMPLIEKYTGFNNIDLNIGPHANLGVDTGYFSPNNVLNNAGLDGLYPSNQTTLFRWFKENKATIFKGEISYTTGKVSGGFKSVPVQLFIEANLTSIFSPKLLEKFDVTLAEVTAGAIVHELGHIFGGCMMMFTTLKDNLLLKAGLRSYKNATTDKERLVVLRDARSLLEVDNKDKALEEISKSDKEEVFILYFNKLLTQRNEVRSLSMGVTEMSSEVIADMYSMRMGCGKGIIGAVGVLITGNVLRSTLSGIFAGIYYGVMFMMIGMATSGVLVLWVLIPILGVLGLILGYFSPAFSGIYNADHRRFDDLIRQSIDQFKTAKNVPSKERAETLAFLEQLIELNKSFKPWYENTIVRRFMGRVFATGDFRVSEVEHYLSVLSNHEINLLSDKLKTIAV